MPANAARTLISRSGVEDLFTIVMKAAVGPVTPTEARTHGFSTEIDFWAATADDAMTPENGRENTRENRIRRAAARRFNSNFPF